MLHTKEKDYTSVQDKSYFIGLTYGLPQQFQHRELIEIEPNSKVLPHDSPTFVYNDFINSLLLVKQQEQDKILDDLTKKYNKQSEEIDAINFKLNTIIPKGYNYKEDHTDVDLGENIVNNSVEMNSISKIITEVRKLESLRDPRDQVGRCAVICRETLDFLKSNKISNSDNYCVNVMRLFYQAVKRNYSKGLFTEMQVQLMLDMLEECKNGYVDKDRYWEFDERLYDVQLSVFPEED